MKSISVKVSVAKLIAALTAKIAEGKQAIAAHEKAEQEFTKANEKHNAALRKLTVKKSFELAEVSVYKPWNSEGFSNLTLTFRVPTTDLPPKPEMAEVPGYDPRLSSRIDEMENAVRLLQMSDEQYVSASTYKTVAQYL